MGQHKILCAQNKLLSNPTIHPNNTIIIVIEFIVIITPSYRLEIPTSLIEMSTYQGPTPTLPRSANILATQQHIVGVWRLDLESATKPLPPALSLKQQSHRRRIAIVIIIEARYRRSIRIVSSSYCRRRIVVVVMWALLHCHLAADATIKSSLSIAESALYHGRIVVVISGAECNNQILVVVAMSTSWCHSSFVVDVSSSS